jgi:hypothetical protein
VGCTLGGLLPDDHLHLHPTLESSLLSWLWWYSLSLFGNPEMIQLPSLTPPTLPPSPTRLVRTCQTSSPSNPRFFQVFFKNFQEQFSRFLRYPRV